jgi:hypothetical protein
MSRKHIPKKALLNTHTHTHTHPNNFLESKSSTISVAKAAPGKELKTKLSWQKRK